MDSDNSDVDSGELIRMRLKELKDAEMLETDEVITELRRRVAAVRSSRSASTAFDEKTAITTARQCLLDNDYGPLFIDEPYVLRVPAAIRRDDGTADLLEVVFPWKPVDGLYRTSRGCSVYIDSETGEVVHW